MLGAAESTVEEAALHYQRCNRAAHEGGAVHLVVTAAATGDDGAALPLGLPQSGLKPERRRHSTMASV